MHVAVRTDAATHIGIGHVMRCITLANAFREKGAKVSFICRPFTGHLGDRIVAEGHCLHWMPPATQAIKPEMDLEQTPPHVNWLGERWQTDITQTQIALKGKQFDWLIVDHYSLDYHWENAMRKFASRIMVIDDLADRLHDCDLLLDQTLDRNEEKYRDLAPKDCVFFTGSKYALLRPEFSKLREYSLNRRVNFKMEHLLIGMGGIDQFNSTGLILGALQTSSLPPNCRITVVMGENAPWLNSVREQVKKLTWPTEIKINVENMAQLMADCDLAIGAAGSTSWERCCLGVPALMFVLAENQRAIGLALKQKQAVILLNEFKDIKKAVETLCQHPEQLRSMSQASKNITDGSGLEIILQNLEQLRV
ncbi:MAG: UDP-2,4-diacetamido-2,4,6-trideoxy-beta-L-altropyranose hydrolase [Nitrospina sp.]|jgi:UDP-2,4-diacetamido-2,4,6-trideoxy-beta-L-altropyranose hydrolase|nr:UDP-2,4-diacetamido-2,4,6-trideoxy-beta-L-altropyranose hydrolase [Nitrospina sp.]